VLVGIDILVTSNGWVIAAWPVSAIEATTALTKERLENTFWCERRRNGNEFFISPQISPAGLKKAYRLAAVKIPPLSICEFVSYAHIMQHLLHIANNFITDRAFFIKYRTLYYVHLGYFTICCGSVIARQMPKHHYADFEQITELPWKYAAFQ
jgi:hypothetical protein